MKARLALSLAVLLGSLSCAQTETPPQPVPASPAAAMSGSGSYLAARHAERRRDASVASRLMSSALAGDPTNFELLVRAHNLKIADGDFAGAVPLAERIVQLNRGNPQANLTLALADVRAGRFAEAQARIAALPLTGINRVMLPPIGAWLEAAQGRPAAALIALRPLSEVEGFRPLFEFHSALIADFAGRLDTAEQHFAAALAGEGVSPRVVDAAARFYERQRRPDLASAARARHQFGALELTIGGADAVGPGAQPLVRGGVEGIAEALLNVAYALRQDNSLQGPLAFARLALALRPDLAPALLLVGDVLDAQGQREAANAVYARMPAASPASWLARLRTAENRSALGDTDGALAQLATLSAERSERVEPLVIKGQVLRSKERYAEAVDAYNLAIGRSGPGFERRHWALFYARGIAHERSKIWPAAEADFKQALALFPDQPDVLNYLAYSWVEQGANYGEAQRMLERAVEQRPNSGHIVDSLGWVLFRIGKHREAVPVLERAVELLPEESVLLDHLGDAYWAVGRTTEARFQWERALLHKPEPTAKIEIERKLREGLGARTTQRAN